MFCGIRTEIKIKHSYLHKGGDWDGDWSTGHNQSPIDIDISKVLEMPKIEAFGKLQNIENATMVYDYHKLQVDYDKGEFLYKNDNYTTNWRSLQFHFHAPAEHHLDGYEYEVELHIVFKNVDDPNSLLVTGILLTADSDAERNEFIDNLKLEGITEGVHQRNVLIDGLYEKFSDGSTFNYKGSLTTPPWTESV